MSIEENNPFYKLVEKQFKSVTIYPGVLGIISSAHNAQPLERYKLNGAASFISSTNRDKALENLFQGAIEEQKDGQKANVEQNAKDIYAVQELIKLARVTERLYNTRVKGILSKEEWLKLWQNIKIEFECSSFDQLTQEQIKVIRQKIISTVALKLLNSVFLK